MTWHPVVVLQAALLAVPAWAAVVESPAQDPAAATPDVTGQPQAAAGPGLLLWQDTVAAFDDAIAPGAADPLLPNATVRGLLPDVDLFETRPVPRSLP